MSQLELLPVPLTCKQIQRALFDTYCKANIVVPNCCALTHEADVLVLRKTGYVAEFEVKVSRADFKADFRKASKHEYLKMGYQWCANEFWFACEDGLIRPDEVPAYAGLIYICQERYQHRGSDHWYSKNVAVVQKKAPKIHKKIHPTLVHKLAVSLMYKAFAQ